VQSVLTSQAIYHLTSLELPLGTKIIFDKLSRAFLWAASDRVLGGKCKVNWELVCRPTKFGGLGILHLDKFACALRLKWPWLEWVARAKTRVGSGNLVPRTIWSSFMPS
jgi:hypothetical protein